MNTHQEQILRAACKRPVRVRDFTEGSNVLQVAPRFVEQYLSQLEVSGLVYKRGEQFFATSAGRDRVAAKDDAIGLAEKRAFNTAGIYRGERWNVRAGGEQHKQYRSRGIDA